MDFVTNLVNELNSDLVIAGEARRRAWSVVIKPYRVDP
jgi:hypothetical protein